MRILLLLAALSSAQRAEARAQVPSPPGAPAAPSAAETQAERELRDALRAFSAAVAAPVLAASSAREAAQALEQRSDAAVQLRAMLVRAVSLALDDEQTAPSAPEGDALAASLTARLGDAALPLVNALMRAEIDLHDLRRFFESRPLDERAVDEALRAVVPLATRADVLAFIALEGALSDTRPAPAWLPEWFAWVDEAVLRHHAELHRALTHLDPTWIPSLPLPDWAHHHDERPLTAEQAQRALQLVAEPPPATFALKQAFKRS